MLLSQNRASWSWKTLKAVDVNGTNEQGWGALHYAAADGFLQVMDLLLAADESQRCVAPLPASLTDCGSCNVEIRTPEGLRPLMLAARSGNLDIVERLLPLCDPDAVDEVTLNLMDSANLPLPTCLCQPASANLRRTVGLRCCTVLTLTLHRTVGLRCCTVFLLPKWRSPDVWCERRPM